LREISLSETDAPPRRPALSEQGGGASLRLGRGGIPPHPPSASPSLWTPTEFVPALAGAPLFIFFPLFH